MKLEEFSAEVEPSEGQGDYEVVVQDQMNLEEDPVPVVDVRWDHGEKQVVISY
jgi:hypothetical protein